MLNVLVVDDEPKHRRGLFGMLMDLKPEYKVFCAMDGAEALQSISANSIDLVFTDIQMPVMDGLELMERLKERGGSESVIIMSAYSEFEYAQRALRLGACDYLLKPVDRQKIVPLLEKAENEAREARLASIESSLARLLEGVPGEEDIRLLREAFPEAGSGMILAAEFDPAMERGERGVLTDRLKETLQPALEGFGYKFAYYESGPILTAFITGSVHSPIVASGLEQQLNRIIDFFKKEYGAELTVSLGDCFADWVQEAGNGFKRAIQALKTKFYLGGGLLLRAELTNERSHPALIRLEPDVLMKCSGDKEAVIRYIDSAIDQALSNGLPRRENLVYAIAASIHHLTACLMDKGLVPLHNAVFEEALLQSRTLEQSKRAAREWLCELMERLENRKQSRNEFIIESCKGYIEKHYAEDLSLGTLAAIFHFNPSYFCMLFKTHTNTTVNQYITQTRMKKASSLLLQTSQKVYEIAEKVGYKDVKYFIRLFRKEFGTSPEEFRHLSATR